MGECLATLNGKGPLGAWPHRQHLHQNHPNPQHKGRAQVDILQNKAENKPRVGCSCVGLGAYMHRLPLTLQGLPTKAVGILWQLKHAKLLLLRPCL